MDSPHWSRDTRITIALLSLVLFIVLVILALPLVESLAAAALIAYLLNPVVRFFMRRFRMRRSYSAILVYVIVLLIIAALPALLGTVAYGLFQRWGDNLLEALEAVRKWLSQPVIILGFDLSPRVLMLNLGNALGGALTALPGGSFGVLSGFTANVLWGFTIIISLYYFKLTNDS